MKLMTICILTFTIAIQIKSQTLISFAGGELKSDNLSMSYSLGELVIQTHLIDQATFYQGIQQGQKGIDQPEKFLRFTPLYQTKTQLFYKIPDNANYKATIIAITGQQLAELKLDGQPIAIDHLKPGIYLLSVDYNDQHETTMKLLIPSN